MMTFRQVRQRNNMVVAYVIISTVCYNNMVVAYVIISTVCCYNNMVVAYMSIRVAIQCYTGHRTDLSV